jgi:hypothetical protein
MQTIQKLAYIHLTMNMEAACYSETAIFTYKTDVAQRGTAETECSQR